LKKTDKGLCDFGVCDVPLFWRRSHDDVRFKQDLRLGRHISNEFEEFFNMALQIFQPGFYDTYLPHVMTYLRPFNVD
jgi:hypothetical protein